MTKRFLFIAASLLICIRVAEADTGSPKDGKDAPAQIPRITSSADHTKVRVGDIITLSLKYSVPEGSSFNPESDLTGLDGLTITGKRAAKNEFVFSIIADRTASFDIGPVSLSFKDSKGVLNIIKSEAVHIDVSSNLGDRPAEAQLKPIMDIYPTYPFILRLLPWIVGALVLGGAAAGFYLWKKRKRVKTGKLANKPAHIIAEEEIKRLKAMNLFDKGEYKEFYFRFSEILRQYIESLRRFPAAELTTEEIGRRMKSDVDRKLLPVLREADLVKFADAVPTKARNEQDVKEALEYIKATTPVENTTQQEKI